MQSALALLNCLERIESRQSNLSHFKRRVLVDSEEHQFSKSCLPSFQVNPNFQFLSFSVLNPAFDLVPSSLIAAMACQNVKPSNESSNSVSNLSTWPTGSSSKFNVQSDLRFFIGFPINSLALRKNLRRFRGFAVCTSRRTSIIQTGQLNCRN